MSFSGPTQAVGYYQAARQSLHQGKIDEAIALLREALLRDPRSAEAFALLGVAYAQKGMVNEGIQSLRTKGVGTHGKRAPMPNFPESPNRPFGQPPGGFDPAPPRQPMPPEFPDR
jgi:tetratricopeptide (TPR) repeat protein